MEEKLNAIIEFLEDNDDKLLWIEHHSEFDYATILEIVNSILENRFSKEDIEILLNYCDYIIYNHNTLAIDSEDIYIYKDLISKFENEF